MHHRQGRFARQAHVGVPEGTVEEEFGRGGFFGRSTHLYRTEPPVNWTRIEGSLRPRAFDLLELEPAPTDDIAHRSAFLENPDVTLRFARLTRAPSFYFRNADADEILFVHQGSGCLESDFGRLAYGVGDYLVIPRGTTHRLVPSDVTRLLVLESRGEVRLPERGLLGQHALFDPAVIEVPSLDERSPEPLEGAREFEVRVQRQGELSSIFHPRDPLNVVGWKGDLTVWRLNVADIRPVTSERYHLPPSAHATFVGPGFVVCTFLPRPLETGDPKALRVPFYHANIDYDEVIFYHRGDFFSREGIRPGMATFHPQGIHHGPQPGAVEASVNKTRTDEVAVMVDTERPLRPTDTALSVEWADYWKSWQG